MSASELPLLFSEAEGWWSNDSLQTVVQFLRVQFPLNTKHLEVDRLDYWFKQPSLWNLEHLVDGSRLDSHHLLLNRLGEHVCYIHLGYILTRQALVLDSVELENVD